VTIGSGISSISSNMFSETGLTSVIIPENITAIGPYAFYNCFDLTSVTIGSSVTSIDIFAIINDPLTMNFLDVYDEEGAGTYSYSSDSDRWVKI